MKQGNKETRKKAKYTNCDKAYFLTLTIVNWIDVFTRKNHRDATIEIEKIF
jgi:hypothetical protein